MQDIKFDTGKMLLSEMELWGDNPRTISKDEFEKLKASIERKPYYMNARPIVISDRTGQNVVIAGNQRYKAVKALGWKEAPAIVFHCQTEEQEVEIAMVDNHNNGEWDTEMLANKFMDYPLAEWLGSDWEKMAGEFGKVEEVEEDEVPGVNEDDPPVAKLGDIYQLGNHRLMCGDSTDEAQVARLMDGNKADMVFTDPPYRLETEGGPNGNVGQALRKQGKSIEFISDFEPQGFLSILPEQFQKNILNAYIFCNKELLPDYLNWAVKNRYSYNVLIWKKPNAIPICDSHRPDIEYLLLFRKNAIWNNSLNGVNYSRCLEFGRELGLHPTMKPVSLIANEIKISSNEKSNVLDLFGGSGSTLIACEQLGRKCFMMELDPHYVDVIIKRWEKLTGEKAVKLNA